MRLTPEIQETIVSHILAGCFDHVAAQAAGIEPRTFRDWIQRGEDRHPSRRSTPELREFARVVREAKAQARAAAEIKVARDDPKHWLRYVARSKPGLDGWTDPVPGIPGDEGSGAGGWLGPTEADPDQAAEVLSILIAAGAIAVPEPRETVDG